MMLGDRIAATTQGIMERMGVRENEIDSPAVIENLRHIEQLGGSVKEIRRRLAKEIQAANSKQELSKSLADAFKTASLSNRDQVCKQMFQKVTEFQDIMNDMNRGLNTILTNEVQIPLERFEKTDIKDCMAAKKKYDKVRISYETSVAQLRSVGKKQKINLNKVLEAEVKKDTFEDAFRTVSAETTAVFESAIQRHDFVVLDSLCYYLNAYQSFFSNGCEYLKDLKTLITQSKVLVEERTKQYEDDSKRKALQRQKEFDRKEKGTDRVIFGADLVVLGKEKEFEYPPAIGQAIDHLCEHGTNTEGIFRISPAKTQLEICTSDIEKGNVINWQELPPHIAAGVIKEFLREMPNPLLTKELYSDWTRLEELPEDEEEESIKHLLEQLPKAHRSLLGKLMQLCVKITENTEKNKMGAKQLAIVLAPNILYDESTNIDPSAIVVALATCNQVVFKLINYFETHMPQSINEETEVKSNVSGWRKSKERKAKCTNEKLLQQIRSHTPANEDGNHLLALRVPVTSLKPPAKPKTSTSGASPVKPKPVFLSEEALPCGDRATSEFKIVTEEMVVVSIEEPTLSVEQLALKRKASAADVSRPNSSRDKTNSPLSKHQSPRQDKFLPTNEDNAGGEAHSKKQGEHCTESKSEVTMETVQRVQQTLDDSGSSRGHWIRGVLRKEEFE